MARLRGRPVEVIVVYHAVPPTPLPTACTYRARGTTPRRLGTLSRTGYPYGIVDQRVAAAAAAAGFVRGVTTERRAVTPSSDRLRLGRVDAAVGSSLLWRGLAV